MATSRSAVEFQERCGLRILQSGPRPRLSVHTLKVVGEPLSDPQPEQPFLLGNEGGLPNDRGVTKPWPTQRTGDDGDD